MARDLKAEMRNKMIANLLAQGPAGVKAIAESLVEPLRRKQDYESIGRALVLVQDLPQGVDPLIDTDVNGGVAYIVSDMGANIQKQINPETVRIPLQTIASNPTVSYEQLASRKYDLQARISQYSSAEIFRVEDRIIINGLLAAGCHEYTRPIFQTDNNNEGPISIGKTEEVKIDGDPVNTPIVVSKTSIGLEHISSAMALIDKHGGMRPTNLIMNGANLQILRAMNNVSNGFFVDFETSSEIMKTGKVGTVYGMQIYVSPEVPLNRIIVAAEPEFTGRLQERIPLNVIDYNDPVNRKLGFSIFENIGVFFHNPQAVAVIKISD